MRLERRLEVNRREGDPGQAKAQYPRPTSLTFARCSASVNGGRRGRLPARPSASGDETVHRLPAPLKLSRALLGLIGLGGCGEPSAPMEKAHARARASRVQAVDARSRLDR